MRTLAAIVLVLFTTGAFAQSSTPQNAFTPDQVKFGSCSPLPAAGGGVGCSRREPDGRFGRLYGSYKDASRI